MVRRFFVWHASFIFLIILSLLYIMGPINWGGNGGGTSGKLNRSFGVEKAAMEALATVQASDDIRALHESLNAVSEYCSSKLKESLVNISENQILDYADIVVERFTNYSTEAWFNNNLRRLAILYYVAYPLKEEIRIAPYKVELDIHELRILICELNETLNRLEELEALVSGAPSLDKGDLEGLLELWRRSPGYSSIYDIDRYGPRYLGVASKGPLDMLTSAYTYTLHMVRSEFELSLVQSGCSITEAVGGTWNVTLYRNVVDEFFSVITNNTYNFMLFYKLLYAIQDFLYGDKIIEIYTMCGSKFRDAGLEVDDVSYIIFYKWLKETNLIEILNKNGV